MLLREGNCRLARSGSNTSYLSQRNRVDFNRRWTRESPSNEALVDDRITEALVLNVYSNSCHVSLKEM